MQIVSLEDNLNPTFWEKCQIQSGKNKKHIISLSSTEFAHSFAKINVEKCFKCSYKNRTEQ